MLYPITIAATMLLCLSSSSRRHGESEPRSVSTPWSAHGMTLLLQVASSAKQLHTRLHCKLQDLASWSPNDTLCPKARGLSPQHAKERTPCVLAARPCFPCLLSAIGHRIKSAAADLCIVHWNAIALAPAKSVHPDGLKLFITTFVCPAVVGGMGRVSPVQLALLGVLTA